MISSNSRSTFTAAAFSAPNPACWQRTFGGHVAGQSLVSAVRTVDERYQVHSLHGYFLRPGDPKAPIVFLVDRLRDGGSFCTRRVNAIQHGETIFVMSASFQTDQTGIEHQDAMPPAPPPDDVPEVRVDEAFDDAGFRQFDEWDVRDRATGTAGTPPGQGFPAAGVVPPPRSAARRPCAAHLRAGLHERPHAAGLGAGQSPEEREHLQVASLDHAMWFMRPFRADEWLLYDQSSPSACGGRALTQGKIYNRYGEMVAAVMQEGLTRYQRNYTPAQRMSAPRVGVLALQGDTREHLAALREAGADASTVRRRRRAGCRRRPGDPRRGVHHDEPPAARVRAARAVCGPGWPRACPPTGRVPGMILLATEILDAGAAGREATPLKAST